MQKVYWDNVNSKEVVDVSGLVAEATIIADHGLDVATQVVSVDHAAGQASRVTAGTLEVFDLAAENVASEAASAAAQVAAETATKTNLGLDQQGFDDLKASLG